MTRRISGIVEPVLRFESSVDEKVKLLENISKRLGMYIVSLNLDCLCGFMTAVDSLIIETERDGRFREWMLEEYGVARNIYRVGGFRDYLLKKYGDAVFEDEEKLGEMVLVLRDHLVKYRRA